MRYVAIKSSPIVIVVRKNYDRSMKELRSYYERIMIILRTNYNRTMIESTWKKVKRYTTQSLFLKLQFYYNFSTIVLRLHYDLFTIVSWLHYDRTTIILQWDYVTTGELFIATYRTYTVYIHTYSIMVYTHTRIHTQYTYIKYHGI